MIASFVVADNFNVTGMQDGDEDLAWAEYLQCKLFQQEVCSSSFLDRVRLSPEGKTFADPIYQILIHF